MKRMTIAEASIEYGVPRDTIRKRLWYDTHLKKPLLGCKKIGRDWVVTDKYMESREWRNRNHEDRH